MLIERDFESTPYTDEEMRVVNYLRFMCPDIGAGDDPIGFLLASHGALVRDREADAITVEDLKGLGRSLCKMLDDLKAEDAHREATESQATALQRLR